jgi:hypothetical protein
MNINNNFEIEQIVFLKHDVEQKPRMVIAYIVDKESIIYRLCCGTEISDHFGFEISLERTLY